MRLSKACEFTALFLLVLAFVLCQSVFMCLCIRCGLWVRACCFAHFLKLGPREARASRFKALSLLQGVVTAATSLITTLAQKSPDDFKTSISLAVARLSRVRICPWRLRVALFCYPLQLTHRLLPPPPPPPRL